MFVSENCERERKGQHERAGVSSKMMKAERAIRQRKS